MRSGGERPEAERGRGAAGGRGQQVVGGGSPSPAGAPDAGRQRRQQPTATPEELSESTLRPSRTDGNHNVGFG